jgi:hypothetical protein
VERGARYPFTEDRIREAARFLDAPLGALLEGRAIVDGFSRLPLGVSRWHDLLATRLAAGWAEMSPEVALALCDAVGPVVTDDEIEGGTP